MPLDFKEVAPDPKAKKDNSQKARIAALVDRKGKGPAPLQLDNQVIPNLVRKVGDWKTGRISQTMCEAYLDRHTLVFDRELLTKMFTEADYQKEGSLDTRALIIAISGRFPKREHTADWRTLTAMLLALPELVLVEDLEAAALRANAEKSTGGTYNGASIWDSPPPLLPPVRRPSGSGRSGKVTSRDPSAEWNDTMSRTTAAAVVGGTYGAGSGSAGGLGATMRSGSVGGALDATGALAGGAAAATAALSGVVGTTGGLKQVGQVADEQRLNAALLGGGPGSEAARSTFGTLRDFNDFARGLEVLPQLAADSSGTAGLGRAPPADGQRTATRLGTPKETVRVWAAPLPPSAISLPPSALRSLRESVRSTTSTKPDFARAFKPLDSHELDLKKTLGQDTDMQKSLARVEPVRDTKVLQQADYVAWCDYAANCRTAPTGWYGKHPAAAAQDTGEHKYPWVLTRRDGAGAGVSVVGLVGKNVAGGGVVGVRGEKARG